MRLSSLPLLLLPALLLACHKDKLEPPEPAALTFTTVRTLAGSNLSGHTDGTGAAAQFNNVHGMAVDAQGIIYAGDFDGGYIRKITPAGVVTTLTGATGPGYQDGPVASAQFDSSADLAFDSQGNLFVADGDNFCIRKITPAGTVSTFAGAYGAYGLVDGPAASARFVFPCGLAIDAQDNLYVADGDNHCIRKITPAGVVSTLAGNGQAGFADGTGRAARFDTPNDIAIGPNNVLYVADQHNHRIRKVTADGQVSTLAGTGSQGNANGPGSSATFDNPYALVVDARSNVYVADAYNNVIRQVAADGTVTTLAGSGAYGAVDGPLTTAQFAGPRGMALTSSGQLLVSDGRRVRTISAQ